MQVVLKPGLCLRALQVATGFIDVHRRHPRHIRLHHRGQQRVENFRIGFAPETTGPAKAVGLIGVVVVAREMLPQIGNRRVRNAVPVFDGGGAELHIVPCIRLFHANVMRDAQAEFVRLVFHGRHDVALDAADLDAVDAKPLHVLDAQTCFGRCRDRLSEVEERIDEHPWCNDFSALRASAQHDAQRFTLGTDFAHGRDAVGEPDLVVVFKAAHRLAAALRLHVRVRIDQSREHVLAGGIDFGIGSGTLRSSSAERNRIEGDHFGDEVPLDDDVHRSARRRAVAVDDERVADGEPFHALSVRDTGRRAGLRRESTGSQCQQKQGTYSGHRSSRVGVGQRDHAWQNARAPAGADR